MNRNTWKNKKKMSLGSKRILAFLLALALIAQPMLTSARAFADEGTAEAAATVEEPKVDAPVVEEPAAEPAAEPVAEPAEQSEEVASDTSADQTDVAAPDDQQPADQKAEDPADDQQEEEEKEEMPAQTFTGLVNGLIVNVSAPEGALPAETKMTVTAVNLEQVAQIAEQVVDGEVSKVRAANITFYNKDDEEIEPAVPVSVSMFTSGLDAAADKAVIHIDDSGKAKQIPAAVSAKGSAQFTADEFSIYAVVETGTDARLLVKFMNGESEIASMYVKQDDNMEQVLYDPGTGTLEEGVYFRGWTTDPEYTTDTTPLSIAEVRTEVSGQLPPAKDGDEVTYYAMLFKDYRITYFDEYSVSLGQEEVTFRADETEPKQSYTVNMAYTVQDDTHHFEGWSVLAGGDNIDGYSEGTIYQNNDEITITGDVDFGVDAPEGHWFIFDENGKGATYNAPQFVYSEDKPQRPNDDNMKRNGYSFGGWFEDKAVADQTEGGTEYDFDQTLDKKTTVYARWIPNTTAPYTVIFWTQNQTRTGYEVAGSYVNDAGTVGENIPYTVVDNKDEDYVTECGTGGHYTGFCLTEASKTQQVEIKPEGDSVLNLYYDRIVYNFRFYLYRESGNGYQAPNNSGSGSTLDSLVTWNQTSATHPEYSEQEVLDSEEGYYYFTLTAYYGQDISEDWPTYDQITWVDAQGNPLNQPVSYVMMVGTELKPSATDQGSGTVKGIITVMDEKILGATNDKDGNYVMVRFPASYYNWRYHIWYETLQGEEGEEYDGRKYKEQMVMEVRSSNLQISSQNQPMYTGFDFVGKKGEDWDASTVNYWTEGSGTNITYHLNYLYNRQQFEVHYFDGIYMDGDNNIIQTKAGHPLHDSDAIAQGEKIPDDVKNYEPTLPAGEKGYVFEGWFMDEGCTVEYPWDTMPVGGINVYAKWRQKQYRVILHPNYPDGATGDIDWGTAGQKMTFRISEGGHVSTPTGQGLAGYEFVGWYLDKECKTSVFNGEAYTINEDTVTTPYDKTVDMTDDYDVNGNLTNPHNTDLTGYGGKDRFWITTKLDIYAKWRQTFEGASGINVVYDPDGGTDEPTDPHTYVDDAKAPAGAASKWADDTKVFKYWEVQKWENGAWAGTGEYVYPGKTFTIKKANSKVEDIEPTTPGGDTKKYTVQLKAIYVDSEEPTPTHIYWYNNDGSDAFRKDDELAINEAVDIENIPTRDGYTFLGWARVNISKSTDPEAAAEEAAEWEKTSSNWTQDLTESDLYLIYVDGAYIIADETEVTQVAADEDRPYHAMFAVWDEQEITINYAVADDSEGMGTVSLASETIKADTGKPAGSTATPSDAEYEFDYWTCDDGTEHVGDAATFVPSKAGDVYEEHTYYAHFKKVGKVTVQHYLKGTSTQVADDVVESAEVGSSYTPVAAGADILYDDFKDVELDGTITPITVDADPDNNVVTLYYVIPITIKAVDNWKYVGEEDPELTAEITGTVLESSPILYTVEREPGEEVGKYPIHVNLTKIESARLAAKARLLAAEGEPESYGPYMVTLVDGEFEIKDKEPTPEPTPVVPVPTPTPTPVKTVEVTEPETGDSSNMAQWIALMAIAVGAMGVVVFRKKRETN